MKRIALALATGALALGLAACSSASAEQPAPSGPVPDSSADVVVAARDIRFDTSELSAPAGTAFTLELDNHDAAPHNVAILGADGKTVFSGEIFGGDASRTYDVPALTAGTYEFRCDVHPEMTGTLTVQ